VPRPEAKTDYDSLVDEDYNADIAEYFGKTPAALHDLRSQFE